MSLETIIPEIQTVSLNGTTNLNRLIDVCKEYDFKGVIILALDNDKYGKNTQQELKEQLDKLNIPSFCNNLISTIDDGNCKDINKALTENKEKFTEHLNYFYEQYKIIADKINEKRGVEIEV